jgi:SAM-dependent methyltransferase
MMWADSGAELFVASGERGAVQRQVDRWFATHAGDWRDIYARSDIWAVIHQQRLALALQWAAGLGLRPGAPVLDVGCGTGLAATALARQGLHVSAVDSVMAMLELTRQHGGSCHLDVARSDVHALPFSSDAFALVVALGVLPWLHSPGRALQEMARVTRPGGYVIANVDNYWRLTDLLDPRLNPLLQRPRAALRRALLGPRPGVRDKSHSRREFDALLASVGLQRQASACFGFGPFTLLGRHVLPRRLGLRLHQRLQAAAERGAPVLRATGATYMVLARKTVYPAYRAEDAGPPARRAP